MKNAWPFIVKQILLHIGKHQSSAVNEDSRALQINIGPGLTYADSWVNVDVGIVPYLACQPDWFLSFINRFFHHALFQQKITEARKAKRKCTWIYHDLRRGLPFRSSVAQFIYASHILEHFRRHDAIDLLKECHRVLRLGGRIRICVPDLERGVSFYLAGKRMELLSMFFSDLRGADEFYDKHKFMYDWVLLSEALEQAGFSDIERCAYRNGLVPDLDILDTQPTITLYIEATKPLS